MVDFNQLERNILEKISKIGVESNDSFSKFLQDQYFTASRNEILLIHHDTKEVIFYVKPEVYIDDKKRPKAIKELWMLISLMEYLIEKRYVLNIPIKKKTGLDIIFSGFHNPKFLSEGRLELNTDGDYLDPLNPEVIYNSKNEVIFRGFLISDIYGNISNNLLNIVFPTIKLRELIKYDFKSVEDRRYKSQLALTRIGLVISIVVGLYGIFSNIHESQMSNRFKDSALRKLDNLIQEIRVGNSKEYKLGQSRMQRTASLQSTNKEN